MQSFLTMAKSRNQTLPIRNTLKWVEFWVCGTIPSQGVVGNRKDWGQIVITQEMFDRNVRLAQVCPFVADSIDRDLFWLEESSLTKKDDIKNYLLGLIPAFCTADPAFDPTQNYEAASLPSIWKTFLAIFPQVKHTSKKDQPFLLFDDIHRDLKTTFMESGLMLGQFYQGCPQEGIYSSTFRPLGRVPWPCFAIRYMAPHDKLFFDHGNSRHLRAYKTYFPNISLQ